MAAAKAGIVRRHLEEECPSFGEIPFAAERRYAASFRHRDGLRVVFVKGAPEEILERCTAAEGTAFDAEALHATAEELAADGMRVLGLACRTVEGDAQLSEEAIADLTFLGLAGMIDPPRPEVAEAIRQAREAGIRVVMITGDHRTTAAAIAEELGIAEPGDGVVEGRELAELDDEALAGRLREAHVFARVAPEHKLRLVRALQAQGEVVAVTGDGVNDAPALKAADIGVAMGRFRHRRRQGGGGDDHRRRQLRQHLRGGRGGALRPSTTSARRRSISSPRGSPRCSRWRRRSSWASPRPSCRRRSSGSTSSPTVSRGVALAFEPGERERMRQPPRPRSEGVLSRRLYERMAIVGAWMAIGTLAIFLLEREAGTEIGVARSIALTTMVMFQVVLAYQVRAEFRSFLRMNPLGNRLLLVGSFIAVGLHVLALYTPLGQVVLRLEPLGVREWAEILAVTLTVLVVMEAHKRWRGVTDGPRALPPSAVADGASAKA